MVYQLVHDLPDAYAKPVRYREEDTATNTWRLFALIEQQSKQFLDEVQSQANQLDISQCDGGALDAIGEMYLCSRTPGESDTAYRARLLCTISSYFSDASANTVLTAISNFCGCEPGDIFLKETSPAMVQLYAKSEAVISSLPVSLEALKSMLRDILAAGVGIDDEIQIFGSFRFCDAGEEQDASYFGSGYGETGAGFGSAKEMEGTQ